MKLRPVQESPGFIRGEDVKFPILAIPSPRSRSYEVAGESEEIVLVPVGPAVEESAGEVLAGGVEGAESATVGLDTGSDEAVAPGKAASLDVDPVTEPCG
jgi:hypothetical protein